MFVFQVSKQALGAGFVACRKLNTSPSVCAATGIYFMQNEQYYSPGARTLHTDMPSLA